MIEASVFVRSLERHDVDRLLDNAHGRPVATRIGAHGTEFLLGEVAAVTAEAHPLLDVGDRSSERQGLLVRDGEEMERQTLRGPRPDPR